MEPDTTGRVTLSTDAYATDKHLARRLFAGPSPRHPEVRFIE